MADLCRRQAIFQRGKPPASSVAIAASSSRRKALTATFPSSSRAGLPRMPEVVRPTQLPTLPVTGTAADHAGRYSFGHRAWIVRRETTKSPNPRGRADCGSCPERSAPHPTAVQAEHWKLERITSVWQSRCRDQR